MDLQADLKWIFEELKTVKDPTLIKIFKNMLQYRKKLTETAAEPILTEEQYAVIDARRESHLKGESKSFTWEEVKQNARNAS